MANEAKVLEKKAKKLKDESNAALAGVEGHTNAYTVRWVKVGSSTVSFTKRAYERLQITPLKKG